MRIFVYCGLHNSLRQPEGKLLNSRLKKVMQDNSKEEQWIDDTLNSINGMQRIPTSPFMFEKVSQRLRSAGRSEKSSVTLYIKGVAAAALLLLLVNVASIIHSSRKTQTAPQQSVYQSVNDDISYLSDESY